jgi:hypothetical protein
MQLLNVKIESGMAGVTSTSPFLSNQSVKEIEMTTRNLPPCPQSANRVFANTLPCTVEGCSAKQHAKGVCHPHYIRFLRRGTYEPIHNRGEGQTPEERFWSRVDKTPGLGPKGDCWEWRGSVNRGGYGKVYINNKHMTAHRVAYLFTHGVEPSALGRHSCDNRICANPSHIKNGTYQDNADDMKERGRSLFGAKNPAAILDDQWVRQIRTLVRGGVPNGEISRILGIPKSNVKSVKYGGWRHVQ